MSKPAYGDITTRCGRTVLAADAQVRLLGLFPPLDRAAQQISLVLYRLLARGSPVTAPQLARAAGEPEARVAQVLKQWPGVFYDEAQRIVGYWGLSLSPTVHHFKVNGRDLYTWCAWDSLFIPGLLGEAVSVESLCPVTQRAIQLSVTPQRVEHIEPQTTVMSLMLPSDEGVVQDIVTRFCHYVHFFKSASVAQRWSAEHPSTVIVGVAEAFELGRKKNLRQYADEPLW